MRKRLFLTILLSSALFITMAHAQDLRIELRFPQQKAGKAAAPRPIPQPLVVSGTVDLDITPYPTEITEGRYLVEYYLDEELLYSTTGISEHAPNVLAFGYSFDTTAYKDGVYKLIVNFWDESGPSGIGMQDIVIKNVDENAP